MTPENEKKTAFLDRYKTAVMELTQIEKQITQLRLNALPGGVSYEGMPHSGSGENRADLANYAAKLDDLLMEAVRQRMHLIDELQTVSRAIDHVKDADSRILLRSKYIDLMGWAEIAALMNYSEEYVKRGKYGEALRNFEII